MKYAITEPEQFNSLAADALKILGVTVPLEPQRNSLERSLELLDLLDAYVQRQRLRASATGATQTLSTDHSRLRRFITSFRPALDNVTVLAARDRALQAEALLDRVEADDLLKTARLLLTAGCRVIEGALMTPQEAEAPDLIALTAAGPVHAPAKQMLLNHVLGMITIVADRLIALGAKATTP